MTAEESNNTAYRAEIEGGLYRRGLIRDRFVVNRLGRSSLEADLGVVVTVRL